jgi:hypothetical protein
MTQPNGRFKLHAPNLFADSAVSPSDDLPAEIAGQPASYFWKDVIHAGNYVHPNRDFSLGVDCDRLNRWAEVGERMLSSGVAIPINCDHSDAARDVVGYVKQFKLDGDRLLALCQFIGDQAALLAARNLVSVGIDPDFTDGEARQWGEAIVHLALTPTPVVPRQDEFVLAEPGGRGAVLRDPAEPEAENTLSGQMPNGDAELVAIACTGEQLAKLSELLGDEVDAGSCVDRVIARLQSNSQSTDLKAELAASRQEVLQLSARVPPAMPWEAQEAIAESVAAKFDAAVERGSLSPAARDRLIEVLIGSDDGNGNVIALSRALNAAGDRCLAMAVAEILIDNQPIAIGETTGLQALPRAIPGGESSSIDQLRQYMTKVASVSG